MRTESVSKRYAALDTWESRDILTAMLEGQMSAVAAVRQALPAIESAVDAAVERLRRGGRLVYVGAGTSGRLAALDGVELKPTFNWPDGRIVYLLAGGEAAWTRSIEGAEDDGAEAARLIDAISVGAEDVVIGLAASGTTPFTIAALEQARARGALTIGVANNPSAPLLAAGEHGILLETGAEVVAGSTRMKAGTAQKAMLTLFSSTVMVRLGRVYDNLMVDVQRSNVKLDRRAIDILRRVLDDPTLDSGIAADALTQAGGNVKTAVLVLRGLSPTAAHDLLERHEGNLRTALGDIS